jgi:hypothetical protein
MSGFFSANVTSPFPDQNALFDAAKVANAGQTYQSNQLHMQGQQMDLTAADHEQVGRLAAGLLNEPDVANRADLYARGVGMLQSQGLAKYAPPTLPDEGVLRSLVNQSVPVADQYKMGLITAPGLTDALSRSNAPLPGRPGYGASTGAAPGTAAAPGTIEPDAQTRAMAVRDGFIKRGMDPDTATAFAANALHESAANPNTGPGDGGASQGLFMWNGPRNTAFQQIYGHTPQGAPLDEQLDFVMHELNGSESLARDRINQAQGVAGKAAQVSEAYLRPKDTAPEMQRRSATALQLQRQLGGGAGTASTAPAGGGRVQVASAAPTVPVTATDGTTAPPGPPTAATPAPGATTAAAAPAATAAPASTAQPAPSTGTGTQSPQFQAALEMNRRATALETQFPYSPQAKAQAASLRAQAALYMQADSVSVDPVTGIQTKQLTGERLNAAAPNAHYVWNQDQGAYVDTTGVHPPVTPPSPRMTMVPGVGAVQSKPGGGATVVVPMNPAGITEQEAAKTSGAAAGTATGKLTATLADQGRASAQAIGNIDYGLSQLEKAKAGGINTGYFAPWLSTIGAVAKSLGVPTEAIGVDPKAVGNIQTAQKTLAVVSGAILQQVLGPDSQITDAKLQHFIHAQPGIETDPDAVSRVLNWARSQFVYEREQAAQGMKDASATGVLPTNWQANYYDKHGFAPIYNPGTGEMQQPDGSAPPRQPPASVPQAPVNPANRTVGTTYSTPKGPLKWNGSLWVAP